MNYNNFYLLYKKDIPLKKGISFFLWKKIKKLAGEEFVSVIIILYITKKLENNEKNIDN